MTKAIAKAKALLAYCEAHPDERFWQALRNWSGHPYIYCSTYALLDRDADLIEDTFHLED